MVSFLEHLDKSEIEDLITWYSEEIKNPSKGRGNILLKLQNYRKRIKGVKREVIDFILNNFDDIIIGDLIVLRAGYTIPCDGVYVFGTDNFSADESGLTADNYTVYTGTSSQTVNWLMEADEPDTPAYRNLAYVVFEDVSLI